MDGREIEYYQPEEWIYSGSPTFDQIKRGLRELLIRDNYFLARIYAKYNELNKLYFDNKLSIPLISVGKLNRRQLAIYENTLLLGGHIRFNQEIIALQLSKKICETLLHQMIHRWQDTILYPALGKENPANWHNKDFQEMAAKVGLPAEGKRGFGSLAILSKNKKRSQKFCCSCQNSKGGKLAIWSTTEIEAVCSVCGVAFTEV